jgi:hypothetical protein
MKIQTENFFTHHALEPRVSTLVDEFTPYREEEEEV